MNLTLTTDQRRLAALLEPGRSLTSDLRPGDAFTTDCGSGVLFFIGFERPTSSDARWAFAYSPVTAVDLTGKTHRSVLPGRYVRRLHDLDTLPTCDTCQQGCYCDRSKGHPGCEHAFCWAADAPATCPGALVELVELFTSVARRTGAVTR